MLRENGGYLGWITASFQVVQLALNAGEPMGAREKQPPCRQAQQHPEGVHQELVWRRGHRKEVARSYIIEQRLFDRQPVERPPVVTDNQLIMDVKVDGVRQRGIVAKEALYPR